MKRIIAFSLAVLTVMTIFSFTAQGVARESIPFVQTYDSDKNHLDTYTPPSKSVYAYTKVKIIKGGVTQTYNGLIINGTVYLPFRHISESFGLKVEYSSATRTITATGQGLSMSITDGTNILFANERVLYSRHTATIMWDGRMYVTMEQLVKAMGLKPVREGNNIYFDNKVTPIVHADKFYREDEVYWLSRIISAESRGEPQIGQIAVGNVVLNRVKSNLFPNTIYSVIFDRKYGVQFSPIANGSIYLTPHPTAVLSAKICLEGTNVAGQALYFLQPKTSTSSWIQNNRKYLFTIKNHDFYL